MALNDGGDGGAANLDLLGGDADDAVWQDGQAPAAVGGTSAPAPATAAVSPGDAAVGAEVTYLGGVAATGAAAASSFWTATGEGAHKWQKAVAAGATAAGGTGGGTVLYYFDPNSDWTAAERKSFTGGLALWSAEANIGFAATTSLAAADVVITRGTDGGAHTAVAHPTPSTGAIARDTAADAGGARTNISIDTSAVSFSALDSFTTIGGYGVASVIHEEGHLLGLGHGGDYNGSASPSTQQNGAYDSRLWSVMSYIQPDDATAADYASYPVSGTSWGTTSDRYYRAPYTPMPLDILAAQRLYGAPTSTPLSGGQVFGFHTNVDPSIRDYFDFTVDRDPVVTLFDTGGGNTLDLSGYSTAATIDLRAGHFSSFDGMTNNLGIAFGTAIDRVVGTKGADTIIGNADADVFTGDAAGDTYTGGGGADVYRDTAADLARSTITDFIAADTIDVTDAVGAIADLAFSGGVLTFMAGATTVAMTLQGLGGGAFTAHADTTGGGGIDIVYDPTGSSAPPAPTLALAPGSDTGASNADGITAATIVTLTGTAGAGDIVTVFDDANRDGVQDAGEATLGTVAVAAGASTYAVTVSLAPGVHSLRAQGADPATGTASATSAAASVTVDRAPPTATAAALIVAGNAGPAAIGIAAPADDTTPAARLAVTLGALPTDGTVTLAGGTPVTAGEALTVAQLTGLLFAPTPGAAGVSSTLTYAVADLAGNVGAGAATLSIAPAPIVTGGPATAAPAPAPSIPAIPPPVVVPTPAVVPPVVVPTPAVVPPAVAPTPVLPVAVSPPAVVTIAATAPPPAAPPVDALSIAPTVLPDGDGGFVLSGRAASTAGVAGVELSGLDADGTRRDLGPAALDGSGGFAATVAADAGGALPGSIVAVLTDAAGGTATAAAPFDLVASRRQGVVARQDTFDPADGTPLSTTLFRQDGSRVVQVLAGGQTLGSTSFDTFQNGGNPDTTFVFQPGHGLDVVAGFLLGGPDHDTLSLPSSDYASIAEVLRDTRTVAGGVLIADPATGDAVRLAGVTKAQLVGHRADFALHG